jgi:L-proline amide hydrolase
MSTLEQHEDVAAFGAYNTWYRVSGNLSSARAPLIVVHGGPGCTHDYLDNLVALSSADRAVVHYDQLGAGRSTRLPEKGADFWTVELFLAELDNLLAHLGISNHYHLLGQSWGGMLGAEHAVRRPAGLASLILSNSPASMKLWSSEARILRSQMDPRVADILDRHEAAGTISDPAYLEATQIYYDEHVCRVIPNPPELLRTMQYMQQDSTVYNVMNGPNEFYCVGTLRHWSIIERLDAINVSTLLISGRFDEATPPTMQPFYDGIDDVRWEIFESSSHMPFIEEKDRFIAVVDEFLRAHDD